MGLLRGAGRQLPAHLWERGLILLGASILFLILAQWVFSRLDDKIPDRLV